MENNVIKKIWHDVSEAPEFPCKIILQYPNDVVLLYDFDEIGRTYDRMAYYRYIEEGRWAYLSDLISVSETHDKNIDKQQQLRDEIRKRWEEIGITKETQVRISEHAKQINSHSSAEIEWPIIKKFVPDFNKEYKIPEDEKES